MRSILLGLVMLFLHPVNYSGDEPAPQPMNKTDMLADMERYDAMKQAEENSK